MKFLLSIETSTTVCSAALQRGEDQLGSFTIYSGRSHAEHLALFTGKLLESCGVRPDELSAVALSAGPGSYTGLRIGTSFAKGLCYALDIPLITIGSLHGIAEAVRQRSQSCKYIIPMMDARRMEVYLQVFGGNGNSLEQARPFLLEEEDLGEYLDNGICCFAGNGSDKARKVISHENALFIGGIDADAIYMCEEAWRKYTAGEFADLAYFEPEYLKEFRATKPKKLL
ncbi:MAG: tRNA (adenosine(37)-N6)-threonylcarbamoyltransferase complex dimerization subunit type 1 TsaB [Cyclobacteriaceae bacterium]